MTTRALFIAAVARAFCADRWGLDAFIEANRETLAALPQDEKRALWQAMKEIRA
jgi:hypothetical protein